MADDIEGLKELAQWAEGAGTFRKAAALYRDISDALYLKAEQTDGLLTQDAIADQARREAIGREAQARADAQPSLAVAGIRPGGKDMSGCIRGIHSVGLARDNNGHGTCRNCGVTMIAPDQGGAYDMSQRPLGFTG